jgi:hypothetical protein
VHSERANPRGGGGSRFAYVGLILAVAASLFLIFAPTESGQSETASVGSDGSNVERSDVMHQTLLDVEGPSVFIPLAIPPGIACIAIAFGRTRLARSMALISATLLWIFTVLGAMSIGFMYLPAAAALSFASRRFRRSKLARLAMADLG